MPTRKLTDLFVERLQPPPSGRVEYFDAAFPALALRVTAAGSKSWCLFYRFGGRLRRFTLGSYPAFRPADARKAAGEALQRLSAGADPAHEKRSARDVKRAQEEADRADTFARAAREYLDRYVARNTAPSTLRETRRILERDVIPVWGERPISGITRRDVIALLDEISARGAEVQANRTLARLRTLFGWAVEKDRIAISPAEGIRPPTKERARDRVLSDQELLWFWQATGEIGWPFGPLFRLLLLTAQRRDEVGSLEWAEIDLHSGKWTIPREKAKNNRAHQVHLSKPAVETLRAVPRIGDRLVFTTNGDTPVSGFSRAKGRLDAAMDRLAGGPIEGWILHDLRRTAATGMASLSVPPHVVDKILNHTSGAIRGVAAVYNRFEYLDERRRALDAWAGHVMQLIGGPAANNVIAIRGMRP